MEPAVEESNSAHVDNYVDAVSEPVGSQGTYLAWFIQIEQQGSEGKSVSKFYGTSKWFLPEPKVHTALEDLKKPDFTSMLS